MFEVDLKLGAAATREGEVNFQVELLYGGLFELTGIPEDQLEVALLVECPRYLFPFARRVIADMTAEGGFPPFLIEPIDFAGVYAAQREQAGAAAADGEGAVERARRPSPRGMDRRARPPRGGTGPRAVRDDLTGSSRSRRSQASCVALRGAAAPRSPSDLRPPIPEVLTWTGHRAGGAAQFYRADDQGE